MEFLVKFQMPAEVIGIYARKNTGLFILIDLAARDKAARIAQREAVAVAVVLGRILINDGDEIVVSMTGRSAAAVHQLLAEMERIALNMALSRPCSVKGYHIVILAVKLHAG